MPSFKDVVAGMAKMFDEICPVKNEGHSMLGRDNMTAIVVEIGLYDYSKEPSTPSKPQVIEKLAPTKMNELTE